MNAAKRLLHPPARGRGYLLKQRIRYSGELITAIEAIIAESRSSIQRSSER